MSNRDEQINDFVINLLGEGFKPDEVFQTLADTVLSVCYSMLKVSGNESSPMMAFSILEFNKHLANKTEAAIDSVDG